MLCVFCLLVVENAEKALSITCELTKSQIINYTVGPIFMGSKTKGSHEWLIEFEKEGFAAYQLN